MQITLHESEIDTGLGYLNPTGLRTLLQIARRESGEEVDLVPVPDGTLLPEPDKRDWLYSLLRRHFFGGR